MISNRIKSATSKKGESDTAKEKDGWRQDREAAANLILLGPQDGPGGLLVAVENPLDAASSTWRRRTKRSLEVFSLSSSQFLHTHSRMDNIQHCYLHREEINQTELNHFVVFRAWTTFNIQHVIYTENNNIQTNQTEHEQHSTFSILSTQRTTTFSMNNIEQAWTSYENLLQQN